MNTLTYDAENRLTEVSWSAGQNNYLAFFTYDADGARIKAEYKTNGNTTSKIVSMDGYYEKNITSGEVTKYYREGSALVAMRKGATLYELLTDHLGSVTVSYPVGGNATYQRYYPWGTVRPGPNNALPMDYTYTGQKTDETIGLMFYNARWYDPSIMRFIQPDPIVPGIGEGGNPISMGYIPQGNCSALVVDYHEAQFLYQLNQENRARLQDPNIRLLIVPPNPQAFDRYAYSLNNPVKYNDPSGHCIWDLCIVEGIGLIELTIAAIATFATLEATQPGRPEAFAQGLYDLGQQAFQSISDLFSQYRYRGDERTAGEIIGQEKKGSINQEFPSEMLGKTADEINRLAREGNKVAQKAQKLLGDQRFDKQQKKGGKE